MRTSGPDTGLKMMLGVVTVIALLMMAAAAILLLRQGMESEPPTPEVATSDGTYTPLAPATRQAAATTTPLPTTAAPTEAPVTETLRPTPTQDYPLATTDSGRLTPASTPAAASPRSTASAPATQSPESTAAAEPVSLYMIALGNDSGIPAGCGDSLISIVRAIPAQASTEGRIAAALNVLFAIRDQTLGDGSLYNALHQSSLAVDSVNMDGATAVVALSGTINPGDDCDKSRIEAQIETTIGHVWQVQSVRVTVNDVPLEQVLYGG